MATPINILSVRIGHELYAFDGEEIEQILRVQPITPMPLTCESIRGVSSISGRTVTIIDMGEVLSLGRIDASKTDARVLTIKCNDTEYGLLVDEVLEMESVDTANYEESDDADAKIIGFYKKDDDILQIIDSCVSINSLSLVKYTPVELDRFSSEDKDGASAELSNNESERSIFLSVGAEDFAISLEIAREIIFIPKNITPISEAGLEVMGMITLRDELMVALDLKKIINIESQTTLQDKEKRLLILDYKGKSIALLVDGIAEVKDIEMEKIEVLPERFADSKVEAIYKEEDKITSIISMKYLREMAKEYAIEDDKDNLSLDDTKNEADEENMNEIVAFQIENEEFALDIENVQEIIKHIDITPIPEAPKFVDGVINLRGAVVPIISLQERLGFKKEVTSKSKILVCDIKGEKIGLSVDEVSEVMFIDNVNIAQSESGDALFSEIITLDEGKRTILKFRAQSLLDDETLNDIKMIEK